VHDGVSIWESAAITIYLGETFGEKAKLWPAAGPKRGEAMKWVVWTNVSLGEPVYRWARGTQWAPEDQRNAKAAEAASADIQKTLAVLDQSLSGRSFLVGDYTLADAHVNSFVDWLRHMKIDMSAFSNINAWSKRCSERPAYAKAMAREQG
jgi:glutathione S-transferase